MSLDTFVQLVNFVYGNYHLIRCNLDIIYHYYMRFVLNQENVDKKSETKYATVITCSSLCCGWGSKCFV